MLEVPEVIDVVSSPEFVEPLLEEDVDVTEDDVELVDVVEEDVDVVDDVEDVEDGVDWFTLPSDSVL